MADENTSTTAGEGSTESAANEQTMLGSAAAETKKEGSQETKDTSKSAGENQAGDQTKKTDETKKADDKKADEGKKDDKAGEKKEETKAPEKYEFKMPEGLALDESVAAKVAPIFKELGLTQEAAQKLIDFQSSLALEQLKAQEKQTADWQAAVKQDPQWKENLASAKRAVKVLADAETAKLLTDSWMGNHPGILKFLSKVGSLVSDDGLDEGKGSAESGPKPIEKVLFADMFK